MQKYLCMSWHCKLGVKLQTYVKATREIEVDMVLLLRVFAAVATRSSSTL